MGPVSLRAHRWSWASPRSGLLRPVLTGSTATKAQTVEPQAPGPGQAQLSQPPCWDPLPSRRLTVRVGFMQAFHFSDYFTQSQFPEVSPGLLEVWSWIAPFLPLETQQVALVFGERTQFYSLSYFLVTVPGILMYILLYLLKECIIFSKLKNGSAFAHWCLGEYRTYIIIINLKSQQYL